jgi:hypothetical protein
VVCATPTVIKRVTSVFFLSQPPALQQYHIGAYNI